MQFNIRKFDIYRKVPKDLTQPTTTGAVISILSVVFILFLVFSEFSRFISTEFSSQMYVSDPTQQDERILVKVGLRIPYTNCKYIGVDIQDDMGRHEVGHVDDVLKTPIQETDGCLFRAGFSINKVPGNFHIATHSSHERPAAANMQHEIEYVTFGQNIPWHFQSYIPGSFNPLRNVTKMDDDHAGGTHDYFLKVVPSVITLLSGEFIHPYQYTYAYRTVNMNRHGALPAIWFRYDMSPITVSYEEKRMPFYHFLTMFCAIIGGTFTVAGIIDSLIFTTHSWFKKEEIGKLG